MPYSIPACTWHGRGEKTSSTHANNISYCVRQQVKLSPQVHAPRSPFPCPVESQSQSQPRQVNVKCCPGWLTTKVNCTARARQKARVRDLRVRPRRRQACIPVLGIRSHPHTRTHTHSRFRPQDLKPGLGPRGACVQYQVSMSTATVVRRRSKPNLGREGKL